ncbi:MAG: glutamine amidotransferase [Kouleothrix sp.]|nr:glutamine amidotransferase [Kouleothrix sp.]
MSYRLRLAHLYPEQMNIYGDRGNILTLAQRCAWRGIEVELLPVGVGVSVDWAEVDLAFFGGGQDSGQALIAEDFVRRQGPALRPAIDGGLVLLAICGGYQLLGHYFLTHTGERLPGVGALDVHTVGGDVRLIGNIVVEAWALGLGTWDQGGPAPSPKPQAPSTRLVGFENHSGRTYLGAGVRPLGRVLSGHGNNGEDQTEGAVYQNTFGCYMHGSLLPKNPQLADHLIALALRRRYGQAAALAPLDDTLELSAQRTMVERLL